MTADLIRRRGRDPQHFGPLWAWIDVAVRDPALEDDAVTFIERVMVSSDPELKLAAQDHNALLIGVVRVRFIAGPAPRLNHAPDDLQLALKIRRQQFIAPLSPWVEKLAALFTPHDMVGLGRGTLEKRGERRAERLSDLAQRRDRRTRETALDLAEEALRQARPGGEVFEGELALLAKLMDGESCRRRPQ